MNTNNWLAIFVALLLICVIIWCIVTQIKESHLQDDPKLKEILTVLEPLFKSDNYYSGILEGLNDRDILNEIRLYKGDKSYTINKEKVFLCLRDENEEYYNMNMLLYVTIHELSHVICDEIGHTEKFQNIFEALLVKATDMGIYNPSIPIEKDYCEY
jgi:hypothetical protein